MTKQKFYETVDKYLMAMGINIDEYADLKELTLRSFAVLAALECYDLFGIAWDIEPCSLEEEYDMRLYTPDLDDPELVEKLQALIEQREKWIAERY